MSVIIYCKIIHDQPVGNFRQTFPYSDLQHVVEAENENPSSGSDAALMVKTVLSPDFPTGANGDYVIRQNTSWPILDLSPGSILYNVSISKVLSDCII